MIVSMQYAVVRVRGNGYPDWAVLNTDTDELELFADEQEARDACDERNGVGEHS